MPPLLRLLAALALLVAPALSGAAEQASLRTQLEALADQGSGEAAYHLGMLHHLGLEGTRKDPQKAFSLFKLAAERGDPLGAYKLGCFYAGQGEGVVADDPELALRYKLIAAEAGYSLAQREVGELYAHRGNYVRALRWWEAAARQEDVVAIALASNSYAPEFYFEGVEPDPVRAYAYNLVGVRMLRRENEEIGRQVEEDLRRRTDPEVMARGDALADAWRPERSPVTEKAMSGLEAARRLVTEQSVRHSPNG